LNLIFVDYSAKKWSDIATMPPKKKPKNVEEEEEEVAEEESVNMSENDSDDDNDSNDENSDNDEDNDSENNSNDGSDNEEENNDNDDSDGNEDDDEDDDSEKASDSDDEPKRSKRKRAAPANKKKAAPAKKTKAKAKKATKGKASKSSAAKSKTKAKTLSKPSSSSSSSKEAKAPKPKVIRKFDRLEEARKAYKWWEAPELPEGINWRQLEHPGVVFTPAYVRHDISLLYDGEPVHLTDEQEEIATFYASIPEDGPQLGNPKIRKMFQNNFFEDFKESLGAGSVIRDFSKCDFSLIRQHLDLQKTLRKAATEEEKLKKKLEKEALQLKYGYALIDGRMEKMGNYNMEPPSLFRGRGEHPRTGSLKRRCFPESVSLNLSIDAPVPPIFNMPGHAWNSVRHDPAVTWLSSWTENVQNQNKYVMLAASSSFKGKSDQEKYGTAIRLKGCIDRVRRDYTGKINSKDRAQRQLGTAMWVIDILALRVGGEKGEDEADTVGCCSLRLEHLSFNPDSTTYEIELEFLGKDSMLYKQNINFAQRGELGKQVYQCLKSFCAGKESTDKVFDTLSPTILNKHLNSIMKGLTAKVFRTYNASVTLEQELPKAEDMDELSVQDKVLLYNAANRQVAILCNHQRTVSKAAETMFENLNEKLSTLRSQHQELIHWLELLKKGKEDKIPLTDDTKEKTEKLQAVLQKGIQAKETATSNDDRIQAAKEVEEARAALKEDQRERFTAKHFFKQTPSEASLDNRIKKWSDDIRKLEVDIRNRDENKEVALGTSKINYMDPRISVAWCKRCEVPIDKIFAKTLRDKFNWAMAVDPDWKFE
jgi:DNA topoisomerase I